MGYGYAVQVDEHSARAVLLAAPVSTKQSIEVCAHLRGKSLQRAMTILEQVMQKRYAIPFKRFNGDVGHKTGIGPGRYPVKVAQHLLQLLKNVKANAVNKGLNEDNLIIVHLLANKASTPLHYGRKRSRKMKRTHIEVMVREGEVKGTKKERKKATQKAAVKTQSKEAKKTTEKKIEPKQTASSSSEMSSAKENEAGGKNASSNKIISSKQTPANQPAKKTEKTE